METIQKEPEVYYREQFFSEATGKQFDRIVPCGAVVEGKNGLEMVIDKDLPAGTRIYIKHLAKEQI